jgi:hypothetical protein
MAEIKAVPVQVTVQQPNPSGSSFQQQAFGPWTSGDPRIQRTIVRTNASGGITQRRFSGTYPPAPTISETRTALPGATGFEFAINVVASKNIAGYNIYSSATNNPNIAKLIYFRAQPPIVSALQSIKIQDVTSASPFYWSASVNRVGQESARVPIAGNPAPIPPPTAPIPPGGSSGSGSGGGVVGGGRGRTNIL